MKVKMPKDMHHQLQRRKPMLLGSVTVAAIILFGLAACAKSSAQNANGCVLFNGSAKDRIAACTKLIQGGQFTGRQLAGAFVTRGAAYDDNHQYDAAIAEYTKAIELQPDFGLAYNGRGSAYDEKGRLDLALADYNQAIRLDPKFVFGWANRALVEARQKKFDEALSDYNTALAIDPGNGWALYGRGVTKSWAGDKAGASADLTAAVKIDPEVQKSYEGIGVRP